MHIKLILILLLLSNLLFSKIYENAEDLSSTRWTHYTKKSTNIKFKNIYDVDIDSYVIQFDNASTSDGFQIGSWENKKERWNNKSDKILSWDFKYNNRSIIYVRVETNKGAKYLYYGYGINEGLQSNGRYIRHNLGKAPKNGSWRKFTRNLEKDIASFNSGYKLTAVHGFFVHGSGSIDNLTLEKPKSSNNGTPSNPITTTNTIIYENAEDSTTSRWQNYVKKSNDVNFKNVYDDNLKSRVIQFNNATTSDGFKIGSWENKIGSWNNQKGKVLEWDFKYNKRSIIYVRVLTNKGSKYLYYGYSITEGLKSNGRYIRHNLGKIPNQNQWKSYSRNLEKDVAAFGSDYKLLAVNGFFLHGSGSLDNLRLGTTSSNQNTTNTSNEPVKNEVLPIQNTNNGEEVSQSNSAVLYENAEDQSSKRWKTHLNSSGKAKVRNIFDSTLNSRVIELTSLNTSDGHRIGNLENTTDSWNNKSGHLINWDFKYAGKSIIYIRVTTTQGSKYLYYGYGVTEGVYGNGRYIRHNLGKKPNIGSWNKFSRNLANDISAFNSGYQLKTVHGFFVNGPGSIDNLKLSSTSPSNNNDNGNSETINNLDIISTNSSNSIIVNAGSNKNVDIYETLNITGSIEGHTISYQWSKGNRILADTLSFSYTATKVGTDVLILSAIDGNGKKYQDSIKIKINAITEDERPNESSNFSSIHVPKYRFGKDYYESTKSGSWHLDYPSNKYAHNLSYNSKEKAYRIRAVAEAKKSDGSRIRDGYTTRVASPTFTLTPSKNYQIVIKMKANSFPRGQHVMITLRGPTGKTKSKWETLWNVSQANVWEEIYIPISPSIISNPRDNKWHLTFFSSMAFGAYDVNKDSDILIASDIDIFEVPKGKELVTTKGIDFGKDKTPFESSTRKIDELGNFYTKNANGSWKHIFPKLIYRDTRRTDYQKMFNDYSDYGFDGVMDINSKKQVHAALDAGLTNLSISSSPPYKDIKGGEIDYKLKESSLKSVYAAIDERKKRNLVIWHNFDNENSNVGKYDYQEWLLDFVNKNNKDAKKGAHQYPIFYLNGRKGLARTYLNSKRKVMDITGTYVGRDVNGKDKNGKKDLESKLLTQILTPYQRAPASVIELQKHYTTKFIPSLFYGILQGGRAVCVWRDGSTKHGDSIPNFKNSYWASTFKNDISNKLDQLLPLIKESQFTSWSASSNKFPVVRLGTRELNGEGYLILANFANTNQSVTINLKDYSASSAVDYFTGKKLANISNNKFTFTIGYKNKGYKVIKLVK